MPTGLNITDYSSIGLQTYNGTSNEIKQELGQADFLALLSAQLANQDPLAPVDNKEFITQMSQFASLDSLQTLVRQFDGLSNSLTSNQALQASALVGRNVLVSGSEGYLMEDGVIAGQLNVQTSTANISFEIKNEAGLVVRRIEVGTQPAGDIDFIWDGNNEEGERMPPGNYTIVALGQVNGSTEQLPTSIIARVESVSLGNPDGGILINLMGLGQVNFNEIKEIG